MKFEGFYRYPDEGDESAVSFRLFTEMVSDSFSGYATDDETASLFEEGTVKIKGFVDDDLISFVKTYPHGYYTDESGAVIHDDKKPHAVEYHGSWDDERARFAGRWEVVLDETWTDRAKGKYTTHIYEGYWEMWAAGGKR